MRVAPASKKKRRKKPQVFDAYRADVSRALGLWLAVAAVLVLLGSFLSGSALVAARLEGVPVHLGRRPHAMDGALVERASSAAPSALPVGLGILGLLCIAGGVGTAIFGLRRVLEEERYLLLRRDGAVFVRGRRRILLRWRDLDDVKHEGGQLVLHHKDGREIAVDEQYGGVSIPELTRRVAQLRRRALFGLLR